MVMPFAISLLLDTPDSQRARSYPLEHPKNILLSRPGAVVVRKCPVEFHFPRRCANRARGPARVGERGHGPLAGLDSVVRRALSDNGLRRRLADHAQRP